MFFSFGTDTQLDEPTRRKLLRIARVNLMTHVSNIILFKNCVTVFGGFVRRQLRSEKGFTDKPAESEDDPSYDLDVFVDSRSEVSDVVALLHEKLNVIYDSADSDQKSECVEHSLYDCGLEVRVLKVKLLIDLFDLDVCIKIDIVKKRHRDVVLLPDFDVNTLHASVCGISAVRWNDSSELVSMRNMVFATIHLSNITRKIRENRTSLIAFKKSDFRNHSLLKKHLFAVSSMKKVTVDRWYILYLENLFVHRLHKMITDEWYVDNLKLAVDNYGLILPCGNKLYWRNIQFVVVTKEKVTSGIHVECDKCSTKFCFFDDFVDVNKGDI